MAVTNAQVLAAIEELKLALAQPVSERSEDANAVLAMLQSQGKSLTYLENTLNISLNRLAGDRTEIINRLGRLEQAIHEIPSRPVVVNKTLKQRFDELMANLMGSPARR